MILSRMELAEEDPYHVQAVYDLDANYSVEHFRYAIGECRKVIAQVVANGIGSEQQIARVNILQYLDLLLSRAVVWIDCEADLLAIVLRSEIGLRGWAELISESPERATRFLSEDVVIDGKELTEKMRKAFPAETNHPSPTIEKLRSRQEPPRIGNTVDYDFKLCSKLVHPSALVLNHREPTIRMRTRRRIWRLR